jgi:hypothetical protein
MTSDTQLAVSIRKAAKLLDCSPATVRRAIERGDLRGVHLMGKVIIPVVEIERHLGIETASPSPEALVTAFAQLVGINDPDWRPHQVTQP